MRAIRVIGVLVAAIGFAGVIAGTAAADTPDGKADLGFAHFVKSGVTVDVPTLAQCLVDDTDSASSDPVVQPGVAFGGGTSSCTRTVVAPGTDVTSTHSTVTGQNFELSALVSVGGPRIRIASYQLTCDGTQGHTSANWGFSGMSGLAALPSPVPAGYTQMIKNANGTLLATAVFNTITQPGDGSTSMTMLTINFESGSGIDGSVTVGDTACAPTP